MKYIFRIWLTTITGGMILLYLIVITENNTDFLGRLVLPSDSIYVLNPLSIVVRNIPFLIYFPFYASMIRELKAGKWIRILVAAGVGFFINWFFDWLFVAKLCGLEYKLFSTTSVLMYFPFGITLLGAILFWGNSYYTKDLMAEE